jgi:hypothetical protein
LVHAVLLNLAGNPTFLFNGQISFDSKEGLVRSPVGSIIINDKGLRGPFLSKELNLRYIELLLLAVLLQ